jgi:hypothetical protein
MSLKGHEDAFPSPGLSARCRFSQRTFAGTRGNGRDAPKADPALGPHGEDRAESGHSWDTRQALSANSA